MNQHPDEHIQMALDAEQQWAKEMAQANEALSATKFHDTSASVTNDFKKLEAMNRAKNQAPLDMVAELKAINERLDSAENSNRKQTMENRIWQIIGVTIGLLTLIATVLFGILGLSR